MSNILNKYIQKENLLKELQKELKDLEDNEQLQKELKFRDDLLKLLERHEKNAVDAILALDPDYASKQTQDNEPADQQGTRKKRKLKIYENPHTNETIETRGGNHKTLKAWKDQYGKEVVEGWLKGSDRA